MGHALNLSIQDAIIRRKRMQGFDTLWIPGTDHAGIATQTKVEERLRSKGTSRHDLGRDAFLTEVWKWKEEFSETIHAQWAKMGISVDYDKERFTLDEGLSKSVRQVFKHLFDQGYIYRDKKIIPWDPASRTALSNMEVIPKDVPGVLYYIRYDLEDGSDYIIIATTRPETIFGDVAIAVHPDDPRYTSLLSKRAIAPLTGRLIPIIADEYAKMDFGSGAVKITPAHDENDYLVGKRHALETIIVISEDGFLTNNAGDFAGLERFTARDAVASRLKAEGLLIKEEEITHTVGFSERSGVIVEPYLSMQWFVDMDAFAKRAIETQGQTPARFVPERFEKAYLSWLTSMQDWCISRQLWWGHQIPAWYTPDGEVIVAENEEDAKILAKEQFGDVCVTRDEDVLDTWFSSALWAFSTMDAFENSDLYKRYYPSSVLVTAYDIILFWVSRMMFMSHEFTGQNPFSDILIHGLVLDEKGEKMSKSKGNGIDPLAIIETYGTDALRFMLLTGTSPGQDQKFVLEKMQAARAFTIKLWNSFRFISTHLGDFSYDHLDPALLQEEDKWILHRLNETVLKVNERLDAYDFGVAGNLIEKLMWHDFCDWYIEVVKPALLGNDQLRIRTIKHVLTYVLDQGLRLLHPFMPFVTEEIWQMIPMNHQSASIMLAAYPSFNDDYRFDQAALEFDQTISTARLIRQARSEKGLRDRECIALTLVPSKPATLHHVGALTYSSSITLDEGYQKQPGDTVILTPLGTFYGAFSTDRLALEEQARLQKQLETTLKEVARIEAKLANPEFIQKAPALVLDKERQKLSGYQKQRDELQSLIHM
jgi:valyl-tRNA synthetase